jgi:thiol-disulfide isomerase/thioredoxin
MNAVPPRSRIAAIAVIVLASLIAVVAGVYVTGWGTGNDNAGVVAGTTGRCDAAAETAKAIQPLARGEVAALIPAEEPADVSMLAFTSPDGSPMTLADFAGKPVLLNLWATWCLPCREEMPALDALQAARGGDRFQVVAVNVDVGDPAKPAVFLEEAGITGLVDYRDTRMKIFNDLKVRGLAVGMPTTLLVDGQGCQVAALHGPAEWASADALAVVDALIEREASGPGAAGGAVSSAVR